MRLFDAYGRPIPSIPEATKRDPKAKSKKLLGATATLLSLLFGAFGATSLLPRVTVSSQAEPFDPANGLSTSFDVINSGYVPLRHVNIFFGIGQMGNPLAKPNYRFIPTFKSTVARVEWANHRLDMDDKITVNTSELFRGIAWADFAIVVQYQPWILPITREKIFRFNTYRETNGRTYLRSWPLGTPPEKMY